MDKDFRAEMIVRLVELISPGSAVSYGDLATITARSPYPVGPRQVGRALAELGSPDPAAPVPWWRVTNARGELPAHLIPVARKHWADEGMGTLPGRGGGASSEPAPRRLDLRSHRADLTALADAFQPVLTQLLAEDAALRGCR